MATLQIPIVKGKSTIDVETDNLPEDVYREVILQGLKVILNRGTSKVTGTLYPDAEELKAKAMEVAATQLEMAYAGKTKLTGAKVKKASGAVMTEARRLARALVKEAMKEAKIKVSHVEASEITKAANALLESDPGLIAQAEANLAERAKKPIAIDVKSLISVNPKLVEKAEAKKKTKPMSAKQAGLAAKRTAKPGAQATIQ